MTEPAPNQQTSGGPRPTRRRVLKYGLAGGLVLAGAGVLGGLLLRPGQAPPAAGLGFLTARDAGLFDAVSAVLLAGVAPGGTSVIAGIDRAIGRLPPATQAELRQLFDLLELAPARLLLTGLWADWPEAGPGPVSAALDGLKGSSLALKRSVYGALHELTMAAWYGAPKSWAAIGYDGPPAVARPLRM